MGFYDSLGKEALAQIINLTEVSTMCVEKNNFPTLVKLKETTTPSLKNIVAYDEVSPEERELATRAGLKVYHFQDVIKAGENKPETILRKPEPETIYMICFTSGTTGDAKGAKEAHSAFLANSQFYDYAGY